MKSFGDLSEWLLRIAKWLLLVFVFLFSFNMRSLVWTEPVFFGGNFNPFAAFFLYLNDLVLVASGICFLGGRLLGRNVGAGEVSDGGEEHVGGSLMGASMVLGLIVVMLGSVVGALASGDLGNLELSYFLWLRMVGFVGFVFLLVQGFVEKNEVLKVFMASLVVQGLIGIFQYVGQGSVGLGFLGEPMIGADVEGVAKFAVAGKNFVRAYGTFLHANVFGGGMLVGVMIGLWKVKRDPWFYVPCLVILVVGLILSFSRSAWLGGAVAGMVWYALQEGKLRVSFKYLMLVLSLVFLVVVSFGLQSAIWERVFGGGFEASSERVLFFRIAWEMFLEAPFGVGLGHFTLRAQDFVGMHLAPWMQQPVHNVFALIINEIGVVGGVWLVGFVGWIFAKIMKSPQRDFFVSLLVGVMTVMLFDHYFWTIYAGQFLIALVMFLVLSDLMAADEVSS